MESDNSLYRYLKVDRWLKPILRSSELHFRSPKFFNDPFDCKVLFSVKSVNKDDLEVFWSEIMKEHDHNHINFLLNNPDEIRKWHNYIKTSTDETNNKLGMLCMSEINNDILMRSHYTGGHYGVCLQFDREIMLQRYHCKPIVYRSEYPSFNEFVDIWKSSDDSKKSELILLSKSDHWEYEKEWRIIHETYDNENNRNDNFPENMLTGIIFGCLIGDKDKEKIKKWAKGKSINYYQAQVNEDDYKMDIVEIP